MADIHPTGGPSAGAPSPHPRPFSLAVGLVFIVTGIASVISAWTEVDVSAVAAIALLIGGSAALVAIGRRRALS